MTAFAHLCFLRAARRPLLVVAGVAMLMAAGLLGTRPPHGRGVVILEATTEGVAEWARATLELDVAPFPPRITVTAKRHGRLVQLVAVGVSPGPALHAAAGWLVREATTREATLAEALTRQARITVEREWQATVEHHADLGRLTRARAPAGPSAAERAALAQAWLKDQQQSERALAEAGPTLAPYWSARALRALDQQEALRAFRPADPDVMSSLPPLPRRPVVPEALVMPPPLVLIHVAAVHPLPRPWAAVLGGAGLSGALVAWLALLLQAWWREQVTLRAMAVARVQELGTPGAWVSLRTPPGGAAPSGSLVESQWVP